MCLLCVSVLLSVCAVVSLCVCASLAVRLCCVHVCARCLCVLCVCEHTFGRPASRTSLAYCVLLVFLQNSIVHRCSAFFLLFCWCCSSGKQRALACAVLALAIFSKGLCCGKSGALRPTPRLRKHYLFYSFCWTTLQRVTHTCITVNNTCVCFI